MRALMCLVVVSGLVIQVGCRQAVVTFAGVGTNAEAPPPSNPPAFTPLTALRPMYRIGGQELAAGTGFVVADAMGRQYLLTAAHVMDNEAEWRSIGQASLSKMEGGIVAKCAGKPTFIGKAFDESSPTQDLTIWPLDGTVMSPAKLAAQNPAEKEWVWIIGQEPGQNGPARAYLAQITIVANDGLSLRVPTPFQLRGFSGGPILNQRGEVVGTVLGGDGNMVVASRVSDVRQRLRDVGIQVP